ncbi:methyltransferase [Streptomyces calidiresistens]|uniref:O-methyltransferase n=1 Tax=Streptomyces calidiresistens TaxID=1485586 RepID=A0A7W3XWS4_9ACTN|nr:methyltransferase [Streptomyces calidiresistens]MBB0230138.1 O-methyltransferase [Streptomyces calidiresistens]
MTGVVGPAMAAALPPHVQLLLLTDGKRISRVLHAVAELRVADELADGPLDVPELASRTGTRADALGRVLRVAAAFGVFFEQPDGRYALTDMGQALRSDVPGSQRDMVLYNGSGMLWRSYGELMHTLRTGEPAFRAAYGHDFFEHLERDPDDGAMFDRAMTRMSHATSRMLIDSFDFGRFERIADIGGGHGFFLSEILGEHPKSRGVLVDRPSVVAEAPELLAGAGVADRVEIVEGNFFEPLPTGWDAYVLKAVLHDWDDERALAILGRVREALAGHPEGRLLICEFLVGPPNRWDRGKLLDLDMLVRFGGRERDPAQWRELLDAAGFALVNDPVPGRWAVLECRPVSSGEHT